MSREAVWRRRLRRAVPSLVLSGVISLIVGLVVGTILWTLQMREPRLVYARADTLPFRGEGGWLGIYHVRVRNEGMGEAEDLRCALRIPDAAIEEERLSAPLAMVISHRVEGDTLWIEAPLLNPGESVEISALATAPAPASDEPDPLPTRPVVEVRAKGLGGLEEPWAGRGLMGAVTRTKLWYLAPLAGLAAGAIAWFGARSGVFARLSDALWQRRRARRAPDFQDDFTSHLANWKTRNKMSLVRVEEKGLRLYPIPGPDLSYALVLHGQPRFREGTIECEVFLEYGALFNLVIRGDVADDDFYMARLDSREEFWDCVLRKRKGEAWRECNRGRLSHHSTFRVWTTMRVDSRGGRISLYRDDELVDHIEDARLSDGNVAMFVECGQVHVKVIRIWRR